MGDKAARKGLAKLLILLALVPIAGLPVGSPVERLRRTRVSGRLTPVPPPYRRTRSSKQFAAKESEFRHALDNYTYQRDVRIQTINDDGKVDGEYRQVVQITFDSNGRKSEHVTFAPAEYVGADSNEPGRCLRY